MQTHRGKWRAIGELLHHAFDLPIGSASPALCWRATCPACEAEFLIERGHGTAECPTCETLFIVLLSQDIPLASELRKVAAAWRRVREAVARGDRPPRIKLKPLEFEEQ
jgi:hypothetical protein